MMDYFWTIFASVIGCLAGTHYMMMLQYSNEKRKKEDEIAGEIFGRLGQGLFTDIMMFGHHSRQNGYHIIMLDQSFYTESWDDDIQDMVRSSVMITSGVVQKIENMANTEISTNRKKWLEENDEVLSRIADHYMV